MGFERIVELALGCGGIAIGTLVKEFNPRAGQPGSLGAKAKMPESQDGLPIVLRRKGET
jgi:hypothetical protein